MGSKDYGTRNVAAHSLAAVGEGAVPSILGALESEKATVRAAAITALGKVDYPQEPKAEVLRTKFSTSTNDEKIEIARTVQGPGPLAEALVPIFIQEGIHDPDERVQGEVIFALGRSGMPGPVVPALIDIIQRRDRGTWFAEIELCKYGNDGKSAVPVLIDALMDESQFWQIRQGAARALGDIGPDAVAAVPHLVNIIKDAGTWADKDAWNYCESCRVAAQFALQKIAPDHPLNEKRG
jgi:HEAT repeat protein